jgi:DDE superfamily endonuclease
MVWACITQNSKGPLIRLDMVPETTTEKGKKHSGGLNGQKYADQVISGPLKEFWQAAEEEEGPGMLVMEDGVPSHRSIVAKKARVEAGISNLTHPPSSPDLNPIEPLWFLLKKHVADIPGSANSLSALWDATQKAWDGITLEDIQKHTNRMCDRVGAVARAKGWHTRF